MEDNNLGTTGQQTQENGVAPQIVLVQPQVAQSQAPQPQQNQQSAGLFNQEQVNAIVSGRVSGLNAKIAELTKANETLKQDAESFKTKFAELEQSSALTAAGIPSNLVDYVKFEVNKLSSNGKSFADNLKDYVTANQSFIDSIKQSGQSQPAGQQNGGQQQAQQTLQSPMLQQLAGQVKNTNGQGTQSINNGAQGIDVDKLLAEHGLKRKK